MCATHFSGGAITNSAVVESGFENDVLIPVFQDDVVRIQNHKEMVVMQIIRVYAARGRISL